MKRIPSLSLLPRLLAGCLATVAACGCSSFSSSLKAAEEDATRLARRLSGADAIETRVGGLEERQTLLFGYIGALSAKSGIGETEARDWLHGKPAAPEGEEEEAARPEGEGAPASPDEGDFSSFRWQYGGVDGAKAKLDAPRISSLRIANSGLSIKWEKGMDCWGLADDEASALACLFVTSEDGSVVGGKFDWISSSRKTRDFKNLETGYGGWTLSGVPKKTRAYFVVVTENGKRRSNVVAADWQR